MPADNCTTDAPAIANRSDRRLQYALSVALLLGCLAVVSNNYAEADLWGHVRYGLDVLLTGELPGTTTYSYTAEGYRWINHENLSELTLAGLALLGGGPALLLFKCLLAAALFAAMIRAARRRGVSMLAIAMTTSIVALNLAPGWTLRPQLASFALFALMIAILDRAFARWHEDHAINFRVLWCCLPVCFVWANAHGGFFAGGVVLFCYLVGRAIELLHARGLRCWPRVGRLALLGFSCALATLINPYGPRLHLWLLESLGQPRPEITEWASLAATRGAILPFFWLASVTLFALLTGRGRRDWTQIALLALISWQAIMHVRHVPLLAILVGFWIPPHLEAAFTRLRGTRLATPTWTGRTRTGVLAALLLACLVSGGIVASRLREVRVARAEFPVAAIEYMQQNQLSGRLVVTYNWAQYALATLSPEVRVGFDGRFRTCYPQSIVDAHFDLVLGDNANRRWRSPDSPAFDPTDVLEIGEPNLVLVDRRQPHSIEVLAQQTDWTLLYQDSLSQLWGHRAVYDTTQTEQTTALPRNITNTLQDGSVAWPAVGQRMTWNDFVHAGRLPQNTSHAMATAH